MLSCATMLCLGCLAFQVDWRLLVGHAVNGYDANSDSSLVSRACRGKPFEREWWTHALLNEIDEPRPA